ncbi:Uncharacterized protein Rs2_06115 [Raphanus sativus]|nr:Uncharacterized protein Rs2_06115 [Raphanus sativus]
MHSEENRHLLIKLRRRQPSSQPRKSKPLSDKLPEHQRCLGGPPLQKSHRFGDLTVSEEREQCLQMTTGSLTSIDDAQVPIHRGRRINIRTVMNSVEEIPLQTEAM